MKLLKINYYLQFDLFFGKNFVLLFKFREIKGKTISTGKRVMLG